MQITFDNLSFRYKAQRYPTLKNIDLTINRGEKVLVVGASGSGKSTLGQCINGLVPGVIDGDLEGGLSFGGKSLPLRDLHQRADLVGTVLQDTDAQFVGLSVAEDIAFALENQLVPQPKMRQVVEATARMVDLEALLALSPFELSGGQRQRVSLAGILVDDVDILLFDEPLASLDPQTGQVAIEIIDRLHRDTGKTVVIIEHRLEDVLHRPVDRIVMLDRGEIVADQPPDQILSSSLLAQYGIREPLYMRALALAGCEVEAADGPSHLGTMHLQHHYQRLRDWFSSQAVPPLRSFGDELLSVEQLCYSYDGERNTLDNIDFRMGRGEFLAVLGKNGSGKSTLTRLLMGALRADSGCIRFAGEDLAPLGIVERSRRIGVVLQNPNHMISQHMIFDEVALGLRQTGVPEAQVEERVHTVLAQCGLRPFARWPVDALSYGQKKRLSIASVLVLEPELLILDEPTAGQDLRHYRMMMQFIRQLNQEQGISILIISHDMHLVLEYCERALVLADGRLLADDSVYRLFSQPELLARANLAETSLYRLARMAGLAPEEDFIRCFIHHDGAAGEA